MTPPKVMQNEPDDAGAKYDAASPSAAPYYTSSVPPPSQASGPAPGVWPPAPAFPNGQGGPAGESGTDRVARLKWNWGAFMIPLWWCTSNRQQRLAVIIVLLNLLSRWAPAPYVWGVSAASLGISVYLGVMGHKLAWNSGRFAGNYDAFIRTQRAWMIWGLVLLGLIVAAGILAMIAVPGLLGVFGGGASPHHHPASGGVGTGSSPAPAPVPMPAPSSSGPADAPGPLPASVPTDSAPAPAPAAAPVTP